MTRRNWWLAVAVLLLAASGDATGPDITGTWSAVFDSQIGRQQYRYEFVVTDTVLTGTIDSDVAGKSKLEDGEVRDHRVTFTERGYYGGGQFRIEYAGEVRSADEIGFTRRVVGMVSAEEQVTARRVK